jgi:hypothetical protein
MYRNRQAVVSKPESVLRSGHVKVALATAICIIAMAYVSRRLMTMPLSDLYLAIPPFVMALYEGFQNNPKAGRLRRPLYWVAAIFLTTAAVLALGWN